MSPCNRTARGRAERSIRRVRRRQRCLLPLLAALAFACACAPAAAAPVVVLDHGRAHVEQDRFLPPEDPATARAARTPVPARPPARASAASVRAALQTLLDSGQIDQVEFDQRTATYDAALEAYGNLSGTRRHQLGTVLANLANLASSGQLVVSRLEPVFLQVERNRQWWTTGPLLSPGARVRFKGSSVIFQYYAGQGLQLQPLANWGRANGLWQGHYDASLASMLAELVPLAVERGGGVAWEYYFTFAGGRPPWVSGMAEGTALQALARASQRLGEPSYLQLARRAVPLFQRNAPTGVRTRTRRGLHFVLYSFAPRYFVLNGFIQSLNGLFDYAQISGDARARALFRAGNREALGELSYFDTGRWSRYDNRGSISDVHYHALLRDFLRGLCQRTRTRAYCVTASHFTRYLRRGPPKR